MIYKKYVTDTLTGYIFYTESTVYVLCYRSQEVRHTAAHNTWQGCQSVGWGCGGGGGGVAPP